MKTKDRIKEEIGLGKLFIAIFATIDMSLVATIWKNSEKVPEFKFLIVLMGFSFSTILTSLLLKRANGKIKKLDFYD